jgi:hypothetical protein
MATRGSQTRRRKGDLNDALLNSAIAFYFQVKSHVLAVEQPSCAEFFGYTFKVNNAIVHNKSYHIPIGSESMEEFLLKINPHIRGSGLNVRLLRCLTTVADALLIWQTTQAFFMLATDTTGDMCGGCKTVQCILSTPDIIAQRRQSMRKYLTSCVSIFRLLKDAVLDQMEEYTQHRIRVLHSVPPFGSEGCMLSIGSASIDGLNHRSAKIYKSYVGTPFTRLLRHMGYNDGLRA